MSVTASRPRLVLVCLSTALLTAGSSGCFSYNWRTTDPEYAAAERESSEKGRYLFVFFKYWLDDDSNRMLSDEVLSNPKVEPLFRNTINLLVEKEGNPKTWSDLSSRYQVTGVPTAVIVRPDGTYEKAAGFMPRDAFIEFVRSAMAPRDAAPRAAEAPSPSP